MLMNKIVSVKEYPAGSDPRPDIQSEIQYWKSVIKCKSMKKS